MRTPNCACVVCETPLYRRPNEIQKVRHVACMAHRGIAQSMSGLTPAQRAALALGSVKGTNHRAGYAHREESKQKCSESHKAFWKANPDLLKARGVAIRGDRHYQWKGGISKLNRSIRQMSESRNWVDQVRTRDGECVRCGSSDLLEAHHITPLADLMERLSITSRDEARANAAVIWALDNGITLCQACHYKEHGRTRYAD